MRLSTWGDLLKSAVDYVEAANNELISSHMDPKTGKIEPDDVREHIAQVNTWILGARLALRLPQAKTVTPLRYIELPK